MEHSSIWMEHSSIESAMCTRRSWILWNRIHPMPWRSGTRARWSKIRTGRVLIHPTANRKEGVNKVKPTSSSASHSISGSRQTPAIKIPVEWIINLLRLIQTQYPPIQRYIQDIIKASKLSSSTWRPFYFRSSHLNCFGCNSHLIF